MKFGALVTELHDATELHDIAKDLQRSRMEDHDFSPSQITRK